MATDVERLLIRIEASQRTYERQLKSINKATKRTTDKMERDFLKANKRTAGSFKRLGVSANNVLSGRFLKGAGLVGALTLVGAAAVEAAKRGQELILIEKRLEAITDSSKRAKASLEAIKQIADLTGTGIDTVAGAFSRYTLAAQEIGATTSEVETLTTTILQLGEIGGGTQQELSSGAQQLAQSLAKGVLNGDELRSVMENMPLVAKQIAEGLGVSIGQLKTMGAEGKLTSKKVFDALSKGADDADARFQKLPVTIERASTRMTNAFSIFLAKINETTGASRILAGVINTMANGMNIINATGDKLKILNLNKRIAKNHDAKVAIKANLKDRTSSLLSSKARNKNLEAKATKQIAELNRRIGIDLASINEIETKITDQKNQQQDYEKAKGIALGREKAQKAEIAALQKIEDDRALAALDKRTQAGKKARAEAEAALKASSGFVTPTQITTVGNAAEAAAFAKFDANKPANKPTGSGGLRPAKELVDFFANIDAQKQSLQDQIALIGLSEAATVRLTTKQRLLAEAKKDGIALDDRSAETGRTVREEIDLQAEAMAQLSEQYRSGKKSQERFMQGVDGVSDAFAGAIVAGESLRSNLASVFQGIARDILASGIRSAILGQLGSSGGGGLFGKIFGGIVKGGGGGTGSFGLPLPFANGAAFSGGQVTAFASGGIVNSPTLFPMANGTGLMSEAGPEGILPLARMSGGKLGVHASGGGGGTTAVHISLAPGLEAEILDKAQGQSVQITNDALDIYDRHSLPGRINEIAKNPMVTG